MFTGRRKYNDNSTLSTTPYLPYYYLISFVAATWRERWYIFEEKKEEEGGGKGYKQLKKRAKLVEIAARLACLS